jgi:hypothetical protein
VPISVDLWSTPSYPSPSRCAAAAVPGGTSPRFAAIGLFPAYPWESAVIRACPLDVWRACPLDVWRACPLDVWRACPLDVWRACPLDVWRVPGTAVTCCRSSPRCPP